MILYATKQTIEDLNIPMIGELSQFNRIIAQKVIEEQTNDRLLEWGLKIFYFDNRKCVQAVNYASKLTIFLFDIKEEEIAYIENGILKSKEINKKFNWEELTTRIINGKKDYIYPAEYFRELLLNRYKGKI